MTQQFCTTVQTVTIIQSLTPHNSMLNMSLVKHSVTRLPHLKVYYINLLLNLRHFT